MTNCINKFLATFCVTVVLTAAQASAQNMVDVYFIAGQSNAGNLGEINSYDVQGYNGYNAADFNEQVEAGFTLYFGRIRDRSGFFSNGTPRVGGPVTDFVENFVESELDATNYSVDNIAIQLNAEFGNDIGIFSYGRNGRALANITDESWFPGTVSEPFNDELYGAFQIWSQDRLNEIEAGPDGVAGTADDQVATVRGIFWFQGENDSDDAGARAAYQTNFENLIARFRADFNNPELPIVASHIRELNSNDASINQSLDAVAANDDFVSTIDISDASIYTPVSPSDVHLNAEGFLVIANDFAEQMLALQSGAVIEPEPEPEPTPAGLAFVIDAPTDVLFGTPNGETPQGTASSQGAFGFRMNAADGPDLAGTRGRGQSFLFATGDGLTHDIGSLSVSLNGPADDAGFRPEGQIELTIFQWDSNDPDNFDSWDSGTGAEFTTGHTELFRQSFPILSTDSWTNSDLLQITFVPGQLQLTDGTAYGFFFRYTLDSLLDEAGDPLNEDVSIAFDTRQDNGIAGALLSTNPAGSFEMADNTQSGRDMNFFFTAGEPAADVLGDFDGNGVVDCADLDGYIGNIGSSVAGVTGGLANLDFDLDDTITEEDAEMVIQTLVATSNGFTGTFLGDLNCDGTVDVLGDAFALVGNLGSMVMSYANGDINFDGNVSVLGDAFTLIGNLGMSNEPTTIVLP